MKQSEQRPVTKRKNPSEVIGNNTNLQKRSAEQALKAAKQMERQRMNKGYKYVPGPNRSMVLVKKDK